MEIKKGKNYWVDINGRVVKAQVVGTVNTLLKGKKYIVVYKVSGDLLMSSVVDKKSIYKPYINDKSFFEV